MDEDLKRWIFGIGAILTIGALASPSIADYLILNIKLSMILIWIQVYLAYQFIIGRMI